MTSTAIGAVAGTGSRRSVSSSIASVPQMPQLDDVLPRRGVGAGARPPVSTVTVLKSVSTAEPVGAVADTAAPARRRADPR